jgi:hypothetical protein
MPQIAPGAVPASAGLPCIEPGHRPRKQWRQPSGGKRGPQERWHLTLWPPDCRSVRDRRQRQLGPPVVQGYANARHMATAKDHRNTAKPSRPSESADAVTSPGQSERLAVGLGITSPRCPHGRRRSRERRRLPSRPPLWRRCRAASPASRQTRTRQCPRRRRTRKTRVADHRRAGADRQHQLVGPVHEKLGDAYRRTLVRSKPSPCCPRPVRYR